MWIGECQSDATLARLVMSLMYSTTYIVWSPNLIPAWLSSYIHYKVECYYLPSPKCQRCNRWSLGMDNSFHPTFYQAGNYLPMLRLKLNFVSKMAPGKRSHAKECIVIYLGISIHIHKDITTLSCFMTMFWNIYFMRIECLSFKMPVWWSRRWSGQSFQWMSPFCWDDRNYIYVTVNHTE